MPSYPYRQASDKAAKMKYLGVAMLCVPNQSRYVKMVEQFQNDFTKGNSDFSINTTEATTSPNKNGRRIRGGCCSPNSEVARKIPNLIREEYKTETVRCDATDVESLAISPDNY